MRLSLHRVSQPSRLGLTALTALLFVVASASADDWREFRGPTQQGHAAGSAPTKWSESQNIAWKTAIPGTGHSSPIVLGDQVWVTSAISNGLQQVKEQGSPIPREVAANLRLHAICVDRKTGETIHNVELIKVDTPNPIHTMNTYASPTPVGEPGRVYCHFGHNGTACVDTQTGEILWRRTDMPLDHQTGAGSSPLLWNGFVIFHMDGRDKQYIIALNKENGHVAWKAERTGKMNDRIDFRKAYATPLVTPIAGKDVLVSPAADWVYGIDAQTGDELWKFPYETLGFSNTPRPIADGNRLYICTGFMKSQMIAIECDDSDLENEPRELWRYKKQVPAISSPLLVGKQIYFVADQGGVMTCIDATSGEMQWQERLSGNHTASPTFAGGHIYFPGRDGTTTVIRPGEKYDEVAKNKLDSGILASLAIVDGAIFARTEKALYRIEE